MENLAMQGEYSYMLNKEEKQRHTVEEIMALPDGVRAELLDGELFMMASPTLTHQDILVWMTMKIWQHIQEKGGKCKVIPAPFGVFLKNDHWNFVEPDIVVVCDRKKLDDKGCHGAPDWIVEVASPSSRTMDYNKKLDAYKSAGVREYWIVDSMKDTITVYDLEKGKAPRLYHMTDTVCASVLEGLKIDFSGLKSYLAES